MKRTIIIFSFVLLYTVFSYGQSTEGSLFDIARNGTVTQLKARISGNKKVLQEVDNRGYSALILACYRGNVPVAEYLIEHVKNINYVSPQGTALASLAAHYNKDLAVKLLKKGADPNLADQNGETPLFLAVQSGNEELARLLLHYKADTTLKNKQQKTVFEYAVESQNQNMINLLKN